MRKTNIPSSFFSLTSLSYEKNYIQLVKSPWNQILQAYLANSIATQLQHSGIITDSQALKSKAIFFTSRIN